MVRDESVCRMELLCPAKGPRELNAALAAGADAIYCGYGTTFNARRGAESFNAETFADATRRSHVAGARIYVTVNVVVKDAEMSSVLALIRRAWLAGADAAYVFRLGGGNEAVVVGGYLVYFVEVFHCQKFNTFIKLLAHWSRQGLRSFCSPPSDP